MSYEISREIEPSDPNTRVKPLTYELDGNNHPLVGGVSVPELVAMYGTPLFVLDEATIRAAAIAYRDTLKRAWPGDSLPLYACKANMNLALVRLMEQVGLGLDVVSGGELYTAVQAGFPMERVLFNGNNKTSEEIEMAIYYGVGRISADNFQDLSLIHDIATRKGKKADVLLRMTPGIECHTHDYIKTGQEDSKFGFALGHLPQALERTLTDYRDTIRLRGLHAHIGSQIFEVKPYEDLVEILLNICYNVREACGFVLEELDLGGGLGVCYGLETIPRRFPGPCVAWRKKWRRMRTS